MPHPCKSSVTAILLLLLFSYAAAQTPGPNQPGDPRNIKNGSVIPDEGYSDQPYVVITNDGAWLCVMTTGKGVEGEGGQHIITVNSRDKGRTWSAPIDIEPATGFEASWVVPFKAPGERVYVFYTYNKTNIREVPNAQSPGVAKRVDTLDTYAGTLKTNVWQHFAVTVDGKAKIITFVVDGVLNDGGAARQYGWGRIDPTLGDVNGLPRTTLAPALYGEVKALRIYDRSLCTSEAVGNFRAGY